MDTDAHHRQAKFVSSFEELMAEPFTGFRNAACWKRDLRGDFKEIVSKLKLRDKITEISPQELMALQLSEAGQAAKDVILSDLKLLSDAGATPIINLLKCYERDTEFDFISTDVYSFHIDRSPVGMETFLCTYHGASSEIVRNDQADKKILIPEVREKLKQLYTGIDDGFEEFLTENFFDLHYEAKAGAEILNLGTGHLWKLAVDHPQQSSLSCIHRAPDENGALRLLLIC